MRWCSRRERAKPLAQPPVLRRDAEEGGERAHVKLRQGDEGFVAEEEGAIARELRHQPGEDAVG